MKRFIFLCVIVLSVYACAKQTEVTVIDTFDKQVIHAIKPKKEKNYARYRIEIKGEVNDSVKFIFRNYGFPSYFTGKVNYVKSVDYYGFVPKEFVFKPYKATKGKLTVTQEIW